MIKKKRLLEMLVDFSEVWPREITPKLVDIYFNAIKDSRCPDTESLEIAYRQIFATNRYKFPDPSAFVDALGGHQNNGVQPSGTSRIIRYGDDSIFADPEK